MSCLQGNHDIPSTANVQLSHPYTVHACAHYGTGVIILVHKQFVYSAHTLGHWCVHSQYNNFLIIQFGNLCNERISFRLRLSQHMKRLKAVVSLFTNLRT